MFSRAELWLLGIAVVTTLLGVVAEFVLPSKYFNDAYTIALDEYNIKGLQDSYPIAMWFYDVTYLNRLPFSVITLIQFPILFYLLFKIGVPYNFNRFTLRNVIAWLTIFALAVYVSMPSKEFLNFIFITMVVLVLQSERKLSSKILITTGLLLFFGWWYRSYYLMLPVIALVLHGLSYIRLRSKLIAGLVTGLGVAIFLSLSYGMVTGTFMSESTREFINQIRLNASDAQTAIISPIKTDTGGGEAFGIVYGFFTVNLPINALRFFYKPQVLVFILWQILLSGHLLYFYSVCLRRRKEFPVQLYAFQILIAYFIVQGVFEPDLGSAIRHKIGVLPLIWICIYFDRFNLSKRKNLAVYSAKSIT